MDIKEIINQRYAMPDTSLDKLRQCLTEVSYPKGYRVLESGKVEKDIFFIKQGIVRAYTSVEGKEITFLHRQRRGDSRFHERIRER